jgi:hypothetical protein
MPARLWNGTHPYRAAIGFREGLDYFIQHTCALNCGACRNHGLLCCQQHEECVGCGGGHLEPGQRKFSIGAVARGFGGPDVRVPQPKIEGLPTDKRANFGPPNAVS